MTVQLHYLTAGGALGSWEARLRAAVPTALARVGGFLALDDLDVLMYASSQVIPELGLNGYAETPNLLHLKLDPTNPNIARTFDRSVIGLLAHEMHHCMRMRGPGYGRRLREALVTEGLACHFEVEVTGQAPIYADALTSEQLATMRKRIEPELDATRYDHGSWFFGNPDKSIPRHCGYSLGYAIVGKYLARVDVKASAAHALQADVFYSKV